jgi:hypothetical protein
VDTVAEEPHVLLVEPRGRDPLKVADPLRAALAVSCGRLDQRATEAEVERPAAGQAKSDDPWDIAVDFRTWTAAGKWIGVRGLPLYLKKLGVLACPTFSTRR